MRYLNKIIFINSAAIKYSEINLNGNIHFIGTQGVGKSTILRAILYFYNAEQRKLGVPIGRTHKSFAEWYFPYTNSFIIYEVQRETDTYCVLATKSQNRVNFRFIDTAYHKKYFINTDSKAFDKWSKIRARLDADRIDYSTKINSNEAYRDIIYGNNEGKKNFKKYALLQSKQYKNIPRTIQNVFLNSKLDADFIKQTIIMSMNEEDITINLKNYTHHLKDFDTLLADIKNFRTKPVKKQADEAIKIFVAINHLEKEKETLAKQLTWSLDNIHRQKPHLTQTLNDEQNKERITQTEIQREQTLFQNRKDQIFKKIGAIDNKLKEAKTKKAHYEARNIFEIIKRVNAKSDLEQQKQNLQKEQHLLSSKFSQLTQKYEALLTQLENQFNTYLNTKKAEKLNLQQTVNDKKQNITNNYEELIETIRQQHKEEVEAARQILAQKQQLLLSLEKQKAEINYKRFYENEIEALKQTINLTDLNIAKAKNTIDHAREQIQTIQKKVELENQSAQERFERDRDKTEEKINTLQTTAEILKQRLENSKNSLFEWLNQHHPNWEDTIGKVCDKDILFKSGLSPELAFDKGESFYGLKINLADIPSITTTSAIADYEYDLTKLNQSIKDLKTQLLTLSNTLEDNLTKIKNRNLPKIKNFKELKRNTEYQLGQAEIKKQQVDVDLTDFIEKATIEKQQALKAIEEEIKDTKKQVNTAKDKVHDTENQIERKIKLKQRERNAKIKAAQNQIETQKNQIDNEIAQKKKTYLNRKEEINLQKTQALDNEGANTQRLATIENQLSDLEAELTFIEKNNAIVVEYNKDKRELFEKVNDFKNEKQLLEQKLKQDEENHNQLHNTLTEELKTTQTLITNITKQLTNIEADIAKFSEFKLSHIYTAIKKFITNPDQTYKTDQRCKAIMENIEKAYYKKESQLRELTKAINKFVGNFSEQNVFNFTTNLTTDAEYLNFSETLIDFMEEDKIAEYEKRVNSQFATIITTIGNETTELISKTGEIQKVIRKINNDFMAKNFVGAVKKIELKVDESANTVVGILKLIKAFNDENLFDIGQLTLFSSQNLEQNNKKAIDLLKQLIREIDIYKQDDISLSDSFELKFRVEENQNNTGWVEKLSNVGSDGTDVLVKAMVNIMLLNVFKEGASKRFKDFRLHCMMDEIGKLHPNNVKGILQFANDRNILLINGSPVENTPLNYKHIYKLEKDSKSITKVKRIISNHA